MEFWLIVVTVLLVWFGLFWLVSAIFSRLPRTHKIGVAILALCALAYLINSCSGRFDPSYYSEQRWVSEPPWVDDTATSETINQDTRWIREDGTDDPVAELGSAAEAAEGGSSAIADSPAAIAERAADYRAAVEREANEVKLAAHNLPTRIVAYNRPTRMVLGESQEIKLVMNPVDKERGQATLMGFGGKKIVAEYKLSTLVEAELWGDHELVSISPSQLQKGTVLSDEPTELVWRVQPKTPRSFAMGLRLKNLVMVEGRDYPVRQEVFRDVFDVEVTIWDEIWDWIKSLEGIWTMLIGTLIAYLISQWWQSRHQ